MYSQTETAFTCTGRWIRSPVLIRWHEVRHRGSQWLCCYIHYIVRLYSGPYQDWVLCERYYGVKLMEPAGDVSIGMAPYLLFIHRFSGISYKRNTRKLALPW